MPNPPLGDWQLLPAPLDCGLNLWEIAALPLRAPTAYHLYRRALGIFHVKAGTDKRREALEKQGIVGIEQNRFDRFASKDQVKAFAKECEALTGREGMHLVCDMLRGPVFEAGLAVAARCGVNVTARSMASRIYHAAWPRCTTTPRPVFRSSVLRTTCPTRW